MIPVDEAVARIIAGLAPREPEIVPLALATNRVLAEDAHAHFAQPPFDVSAMDGYAARAADAAKLPATLKLIGTSPAGKPYPGQVGAGECVRIFTGGVVPQGADCIIIQEDTKADGAAIAITEAPRPGQHIRKAGIDFKAGDTLCPRGKRLTARDITLLAAGDFATLKVVKKPRISIVATGDELSRPGMPREAGGVVASTLYGIAALVEKWGGVPIDLGILPDRPEAFAKLPLATKDCDLVVTLGGASVGDHDLVQSALKAHGFLLDFWKIAMRPGKPLIFGRLNEKPMLGLPGNPVSAVTCAILFLRPAIAKMLGMNTEAGMLRAKLGADVKANDSRQDYIRARIIYRDGELVAEPFTIRDSSVQSVLAQADCFIIRPPHAPAATLGDNVTILPLDEC